ncbi:hypothetical protein HOG48_01930 [Candidatus Peregrinibacteria bacterium]|jgi:N-formylglutamate amidohydrolase|nr:hypothetical protein [Candidatus Peregrinibacteria bacterium]
MYPIIITAPHACSKVTDPSILRRLDLNEYEIFKFSDPYTNQLEEFTCTDFKHVSEVHRLVCDFNRAPDTNTAFHMEDFFGRDVFKPGKEFTKAEKLSHLEKYWWPFHDGIIESIFKLDEEAHEVILLVDYHNTSGDHPLGDTGKYMPSIVISNLGKGIDGEDENALVSLPNKHLKFFHKRIEEKLGVKVEMNTIYKGGYNTIWTKQLRENLDINAKLYAVQIEYNLDYVFNPISRKTDFLALKKMQNAFNDSLIELYEILWADECNMCIQIEPGEKVRKK